MKAWNKETEMRVPPELRARSWGLALTLLALALLAIGARRTHTVFDKGAAAFGMDVSEPISEWELNRDSTFSGVESAKDRDRLLTTYDRAAPRGKQACPT
jgi:hypothetical protein